MVLARQKSKFLTLTRFAAIAPRITDTVRVHNSMNHVYLGEVSWCNSFRKFAFYPAVDTVFDSNCLADILAVIDLLMGERK